MLDLRISRDEARPAEAVPAGGRQRVVPSRKKGTRDSRVLHAYKGRPAAKPASSPGVKAAPPKPAAQPAPEVPKPPEPAKEHGAGEAKPA